VIPRAILFQSLIEASSPPLFYKGELLCYQQKF
jgi:hypothetical protein